MEESLAELKAERNEAQRREQTRAPAGTATGKPGTLKGTETGKEGSKP
jgi:hypothetical protein